MFHCLWNDIPCWWHYSAFLKTWIQGFPKLFLDPWLPNCSVLWKAVPYQSATEGTHWADSKKQCLLLLHMWLWMIWLKSQHTYPLEYRYYEYFFLIVKFFFRRFSSVNLSALKAAEVCRKLWLQLPSSLGWFPRLCSLSLLTLTSTTCAQAVLPDPMYKW